MSRIFRLSILVVFLALFLLVVPGQCTVNDLTVHEVDEDGLVILGTDSIMTTVQGTGSAPDGDRFINDPWTFLVAYSTHTAACTLKVEAPVATVETAYGSLTVPNVSITIPAGNSLPQFRVLKVPVMYNTSGKVIVKALSGSDPSSTVNIAAIRVKH